MVMILIMMMIMVTVMIMIDVITIFYTRLYFLPHVAGDLFLLQVFIDIHWHTARSGHSHHIVPFI